MTDHTTTKAARARYSPAGVAATIALVVLSAISVAVGLWKVLGISWVAFLAMVGGALLGAGSGTVKRASGLVWSFGLSSGAMITSAAVFLLPEAIGHDVAIGGFGVALGVIAGFAVHTIGHQLTHRELPFDPAVVELTAHAIADGIIIGIVYAAMPELGLLLGLAIVSHKAPAGYAAARRLAHKKTGISVILLPAAAVGVAALAAGLLNLPQVPSVNALVVGFAAGVFLHVAMDFLPRCELGSEIYDMANLAEGDHLHLDRLRLHAAASTVIGGLAIFIAWILLNA